MGCAQSAHALASKSDMLLSFRFLFKRDVTWLSAKSEAIQSGDLKGSYIKMEGFFVAVFLVGSQ